MGHSGTIEYTDKTCKLPRNCLASRSSNLLRRCWSQKLSTRLQLPVVCLWVHVLSDL